MRHSERGSFNTCPYRYHLEKSGLRRVQSSSRSDDRTFGQAVHEGLKAHYDGKSWEEIKRVYSEIYPEDRQYKTEAKNFTSGLRALENYRTYWSEQDKLWEILGTEVAGRVEFNDEEHSLHIDLIARHKQTEEVWAWDHKCTEKQLGKGFWKKYEVDSQITRYTKYVKDQFKSCGGFIINGIQVGHRLRAYKGEPAGYYQNFDRQPFSRNDAQIKFWESSEMDWQKTIKFCEDNNVWPKHLSSLCGYCDYYELCMSANNESVKETIFTYDEKETEINIIDETH